MKPVVSALALDHVDRTVHDCWNRIGVRGDRSCGGLAAHTHCRNCPTYSAAAAELLDRPLPEAHRRESTAHYASTRAGRSCDAASAVVFRLGPEWLALPTSNVYEVAEPRPIHPLPRRRATSRVGLVNVRGDLVIHVSLAELLEIDAGDRGAAAARRRAMPRLLVVGDASTRLAFDVDEVAEVCRFNRAELRPVPSTLARASVVYTTGMLTLGKRVVGCLDAERVLPALAAPVG